MGDRQDHDEQDFFMEPAAAAQLLNRTGNCLGGRARYDEARLLLTRAAKLGGTRLGAETTDNSVHRNELEHLRLRSDHTTAARPVLERAPAISEAATGSDHLEVAITLYNLAKVLRAQGGSRVPTSAWSDRTRSQKPR